MMAPLKEVLPVFTACSTLGGKPKIKLNNFQCSVLGSHSVLTEASRMKATLPRGLMATTVVCGALFSKLIVTD